MSDQDDGLIRITARTAVEICQGRSLSPEALALLDEKATPAVFVERLADVGQFLDLENFLAHALGKREAVWWACQCVRRAVGMAPKPDEDAALKAAEAWAAAPGDVNRRKTFPLAEAVGFGHPAGAVAVAAWFSGGSLAPANLKDVPPAPHLTGDCCAAAIQSAAVLNDPTRADDAHRAFIEIGLDVARGKNRWKDHL